MIKLDYVMSGTSYARMYHGNFRNNPRLVQELKKQVQFIRENTNQHISYLFNAFVEKNYGIAYSDLGIDNFFDKVYSDSGGLQLVTQGKKNITDSIKNDIYNTQNKYSNIAMCFDEIPVKLADGVDKSVRGDKKMRYLDKTIIKDKALLTGKNVNNQINFFKDHCHKTAMTKPVAIIHGQNYDTFMLWTENMMAGLSLENRELLDSVAISSACGGDKPIDELEKAFYINYLPIPKFKQYHLLGMGSLRRAAPILLCIHKGVFKDGTIISYDSTTHSSSPILGQYYGSNNVHSLGKSMNDGYQTAYEEVNRYFGIDYTIDEFFKSCTTSVMEYAEKYNNNDHVIETGQKMSMASVYNFMKHIDELVLDRNKVLKLFEKDYTLYEVFLNEVNTLSEFNKWLTEAGRYLESNKIMQGARANLKGLYDD